ncbi:MAG: Trm112 family protein [Proteobacteria bacterium]|nr:Trm112 family protein [Pseudomonadota bacterium]NCA27967.1 Trm112 family protein [Pseudomonadota bacterium]
MIKNSNNSPKNNFNPKILEILRCPQSKSKLVYDSKDQKLISLESKLSYPIIDGIAIMLIDKARKLD